MIYKTNYQLKKAFSNKPARKWIGKKTRAWRNCVVRLKKKFERMGITSCELKYEGCWRDESLGFAHGRKRRWLAEDELEQLVVLACNPCHDRIETLPADEMFSIVRETIAARTQ
jgi:uncharacterized protein YlxP (DUF503 family)